MELRSEFGESIHLANKKKTWEMSGKEDLVEVGEREKQKNIMAWKPR